MLADLALHALRERKAYQIVTITADTDESNKEETPWP